MKLENKVAIVTGAASGIGRAIAMLYAKEGAKVVVSDINLEAAETVVKEIESASGSAIAVATNVAKQEEALNKKNLQGYIELDAQFHDIIAKLSGSDRLLELIQTLRRHMLRYRTHVVSAVDTAIRSVEGHRRIVNAIEQENAAMAVEVLQHHFQQAKEDILQYVFSEKH